MFLAQQQPTHIKTIYFQFTKNEGMFNRHILIQLTWDHQPTHVKSIHMRSTSDTCQVNSSNTNACFELNKCQVNPWARQPRHVKSIHLRWRPTHAKWIHKLNNQAMSSQSTKHEGMPWAHRPTHVKSIHPAWRHVLRSPTNTCQRSHDANWYWERDGIWSTSLPCHPLTCTC